MLWRFFAFFHNSIVFILLEINGVHQYCIHMHSNRCDSRGVSIRRCEAVTFLSVKLYYSLKEGNNNPIDLSAHFQVIEHNQSAVDDVIVLPINGNTIKDTVNMFGLPQQLNKWWLNGLSTGKHPSCHHAYFNLENCCKNWISALQKKIKAQNRKICLIHILFLDKQS